ncbi:MAG: VWA domain-containing protein [Vicinamibacterales bacterium]
MTAWSYRKSRVACTLTVLVVTGMVTAREQDRFKVPVNVVPIYATVTDEGGALVTNLRLEDFEVLDEGKHQQVNLFKSDVQPLTVAVLLDTSPSLFETTARMQTLVGAFVRSLLPDDRAAVGTFSHVVTLNRQLSNDAETLLRRLGDDAPFPAGTALWDAIDVGRATVTSEGGRRVVLVLTDAVDNSSASDIPDIRTRLEREGVMVYGVGVRGRNGLQARDVTGIARATGGWYFALGPNDDPMRAGQKIAEELHRQYVLGFAPRVLDGKMHRIDVRVKRSGVTVRARRNYWASDNGPVR